METFSVQSVIQKPFTCSENNKIGMKIKEHDIVQYKNPPSSLLCNKIKLEVNDTESNTSIIMKYITQNMNGKCYTHDVFVFETLTEPVFYRAKIKVNTIRKEGSIIYIQDTLGNSVQYKTFDLLEFRDIVDDYKEYTFLDLFFEIFGNDTQDKTELITGDIPILSTYVEKDGLACNDVLPKQYFIVSEPVFKNKAVFDSWYCWIENDDEINMTKFLENCTIHEKTIGIRLHNITYIVPISEDENKEEEKQVDKYTTNDIFEINIIDTEKNSKKVKFKNCCIESSTGFKCSIMININAHQLLNLLITQETLHQQYDERFWKRLFFLTSFFDDPRINLTIDKKIMDKKGVQDHFLKSYVSFKNQYSPNIKLKLNEFLTLTNPSGYTKTSNSGYTKLKDYYETGNHEGTDNEFRKELEQYSAFDIIKSNTMYFRPPITKASEIFDKILFHKANANIVFTSNNINNAIRNLKMGFV